MRLSERDVKRLDGVHPDLVRVIVRAAEATDLDFIVTEGLRSVEKQKLLVEKGASQTMKSRHLTGHAVDLAAKIGGEIRWDWPLYERLAKIVKGAAAIEGVAVEWGGSWPRFKDGPHFQLPWGAYP